MELNCFENSICHSICYRIEDVIIDPGDEWDNFKAKMVLLTHAHFDHIYGLNRFFELNPNAYVYTNEFGRMMLFNDRKNLSRFNETPFFFNYPERVAIVNDGDEIKIGEDIFAKAIFTPGHNPSCITWLVKDCLFTGDAYIPGIKTVTNLPDSNKQQAKDSIELIKRLAVGRTIYPGHRI